MPASISPQPAQPRGVSASSRKSHPPNAAKTASRLIRIEAWAGGAWRCATTWSV